KLELNLVSIAHNLKKVWLARGKISNKKSFGFFYLIIAPQKLNVTQPVKCEGARIITYTPYAKVGEQLEFLF
ncbi:MAG: hypothetical protein NTX24_02410, partial [Candidatus Pacearchaeota archaeon]|nr:hypothetical protein [Candidatus Pacearchaeota archaeon]